MNDAALVQRRAVANSPTQEVGVLVPAGGDELTYERMRWWFVPRWWSKTRREVPSTFNARVEGIATKPMFRDAFKRRRCIVPASGFFEWSGPKAARQPWYISAADGDLLGFAGLYDKWNDPETGDELRSCTIIVGPANRFMSSIHERMPVILGPAAWPAWFEAPNESLLRPAPEDLLQRWPVTPAMNANRYEAADAIEAIGEPVHPN